jgi:hypothetical protein
MHWEVGRDANWRSTRSETTILSPGLGDWGGGQQALSDLA